MKTENLILMGAVAAAVWMVWSKTAKTGATAGKAQIKPLSTEVLNGGQPWDNGWRYFSDGTSISPQGDYYLNGAMVYKASPDKVQTGADDVLGGGVTTWDV